MPAPAAITSRGTVPGTRANATRTSPPNPGYGRNSLPEPSWVGRPNCTDSNKDGVPNTNGAVLRNANWRLGGAWAGHGKLPPRFWRARDTSVEVPNSTAGRPALCILSRL